MNAWRHRWGQGARVAMRWGLGGVFLWAGMVKLAEPEAFAQAVAAYRLLPGAWTGPFAAALAGAEVVVGGCLAAGVWTRSGALAALGLLTVFGTAMVINLIRGVDVSCGCFGDGAQASGLWAALGRDVALGGMAAWLVGDRQPLPVSVDAAMARRRETR